MPIKFVVKIVQLKVYIIFSQSNDLNLHSRSQLHLKQYLSYGIQNLAYYLDLGARSQWVCRGKKSALKLS